MDWEETRRLEAKAFEILASGDDQGLLGVAGDLAGTIRELLRDEELWERLESGAREMPARRQLTQLLLVDWRALLPDDEDAEQLEDELVDAISQATDERSWGQARELLGWLAGRLEDDAGSVPPPPAEKGRWRGIRDRVGYAVSAVRRVRIGSILADILGQGALNAGGAFAAALIFGVPFGPAAPIVAAALAGLGAATASELRRGYKEAQEDHEGRHLDTLLDDEGLLPVTIGRMRTDVELIKDFVNAGAFYSEPDAEEGVLPQLWRLRLWAARVGARLAAAWPFVAGQLGEKGTRALEAVTGRLLTFKAALRSMARAAETEDSDAILGEVPILDAALDKIEAALYDFTQALGDAGFGAPHP